MLLVAHDGFEGEGGLTRLGPTGSYTLNGARHLGSFLRS